MDTGAKRHKEIFFSTVMEGYVVAIIGFIRRDPRLLEARCVLTERTPLMVAAKAGHVKVVKVLLELGANINAQDRFGITPVMLAAANGHKEVVSLLLKAGAMPFLRSELGLDALMFACIEGNETVLRMLIQQTPLDPSNVIHRHSATKAFWATSVVGKEHPGCARALLMAGADYQFPDNEGQTPRKAAEDLKRQNIVAVIDWWEREQERPYALHRARRLQEDLSTLPHTPTPPRYMATRALPSTASPQPLELPSVELAVLRTEGFGWVSAAEGEASATVDHVLHGLNEDLYVELMGGMGLQVVRRKPIALVSRAVWREEPAVSGAGQEEAEEAIVSGAGKREEREGRRHGKVVWVVGELARAARDGFKNLIQRKGTCGASLVRAVRDGKQV